MSRIHRALLLAVLALTLGFALAPAHAIEFTPVPVPLVRCSTATGAGDTEAEAIQNALDILKTRMWISSYTVLSSFCSEEQFYTGNPLDPWDTIILCGAEVRACGIPKPIFP